MPPLSSTPLLGAEFNLNAAGIAGFFGGKEAISAMATVHLYEGRRYLGWSNSPGSYTIAKRFGRMASSSIWRGLFPGPNDSPAVTLGLDRKKGPQYFAPFSGTTLSAGHLAHLTVDRVKDVTDEGYYVIKGERETNHVDVAYLVMKDVDLNAIPIELEPLSQMSALAGLLPIVVSVAFCVACAWYHDWFSFTTILIGIISSGVASLVIGRGKLSIKPITEPAHESPPAHGLLIAKGKVVVIKGKEKDVNLITKAHFELKPSSGQVDKTRGRNDGDEETGGKRKNSEEMADEHSKTQNGGERPNGTSASVGKSDENGHGTGPRSDEKKEVADSYHMIGVSSLLLLLQFLVQLLLVPQGTLLGQIMFLISLGVSWLYNTFLASLEMEKIQTKILWRAISEPKMIRFRTGTRTVMTVLACLLVFHGVDRSSAELEGYDGHDICLKVLNACIPNDTPVWRRWKNKVIQQLLNTERSSAPKPFPYLKEDAEDLPRCQRELLKDLLTDAEDAFNGYFGYLEAVEECHDRKSDVLSLESMHVQGSTRT